MNDPLAGGFRIGDHAVQPSRGRIVSLAGEARVEPRAMDVLVALARRAGDTVSRDDLIDAVWKHPYVSDEALSRCISMLRHALGDDRSQPRYLETIPKRGYRLVAAVQIAGAETASGNAPRPPSESIPDWSRTNLALQPTPILGRESELAEVRALLASHRLVTLTGSSGVGKTRLALEVGSQSVHDFADGVWLIELAPVSDPALIPSTVAAAVGIELGHARTLKTLVQQIARRNVLVILDNCEHLIDAAAALAEAILGGAPGVRLLATSQMLIGVAGEQAYPVPSLAVPDEDRLAVDQVISAAAVQLFVERAKLADPHFRLVDRNAAPVAAICRRLEGIPLAIEMAAARAPMLGVEALAQLLDERFRVLTGGRRTALPRHQTLRATLDWSFGLLSAHERTVFSRLAAFAGGFTLEAASAIAADDVIDEIEVVDLLSDLIARSLVVADANPIGKRYRLLETTRAYALERLNESGDGDRARTQHLLFYVAFAEKVYPELCGPDQAGGFARLDLERENFLAAHAWCGHTGGGAEQGLRLVFAMRFYWIHRGGLELGYRVAMEALKRASAQQRSLARCQGLYAAAKFASCMGHYAEAQGYLEESLSIAREVGDGERVAMALLSLGEQFYAQRKLPDARRHMEEALPLARRLEKKIPLVAVLMTLAELSRLERDPETAESLYLESLALARELGDLGNIIICLANLASVSIARGVGERPRGMLLEALALVEETGSKPLGASVLQISTGLAAFFGAWGRAARHYGMANAQLEQIGLRPDPADEAFLSPLMARAREALGADAFAAAEAAGRALSYDTALAEVRGWLREDTSNPGQEIEAMSPSDRWAAAHTWDSQISTPSNHSPSGAHNHSGNRAGLAEGSVRCAPKGRKEAKS